VQHQRHACDRRTGHHHQFEETASGSHGRTADDVADGTDQRQSGEQHDEARRDRHRRFEVQAELGAQPIEHQRRRGGDGSANRVLEEEREALPVESPVDPVDRHGA
jgi:hypothetical protein